MNPRLDAAFNDPDNVEFRIGFNCRYNVVPIAVVRFKRSLFPFSNNNNRILRQLLVRDEGRSNTIRVVGGPHEKQQGHQTDAQLSLRRL